MSEDLQPMSRDLVVAVGGPLEAMDSRKSWLSKVAERSGLSLRVVKAAFYGEKLSRETEHKLKQAAACHEAANLAGRFEHLASSLRVKDEGFYQSEIVALVDAARALRGLARPTGTDGEK